MHHNTCSGCPQCNTEMRSLMSMTSEQYCDWLIKRTLRTAARRGELRTGIHPHQLENEMEDYGPINSYAPHIARLRAAATQTPEAQFEEQFKAERLRQLEIEHAAFDDHEDNTALSPWLRFAEAQVEDFAAPDPYAASIAKLRSEGR